MPTRGTASRSPAARAAAFAACAACAAALSSCSKPLFTDADARTQFDRYDRSRNQFAPQFVEDEYGRRTPNLRGRLAPKN